MTRDRMKFEERIAPHLDAAYNLARWLLRSEQDAEDAVQDAVLRALKYGAALQDGDARPWLLGIVRNTCFTALARHKGAPAQVDFDDELYAAEIGAATADDRSNPEVLVGRERQRRMVNAAIAALSPTLREVIVLREFEDLAYADMAAVMGVPVGTVMSRLSRAREKLKQALTVGAGGQ